MADVGLACTYFHSPPPVVRLPAQESAITCAAFSSDGRFALSGAADGSVRLWNLLLGAEVFAFEGHTAPVQTVAFSPDGRTALSGSDDGTVRTWDTTTGAALATPLRCRPRNPDAPANGPALPSFDFCFTSQGGRIVSCDGTDVKLWDVHGSLIQKLPCRIGRVRIAPDGSAVVSMTPDAPPEVTDLAGQRPARLFDFHHRGAIDAAWSLDGRLLVTAGYDNTLTLWDVKSGGAVRGFRGATAPLRTLAICSSGKRVLAGGDDHSLRVWDLDSAAELLTFTGHAGTILACAMSPDGLRAVSGGSDRGLLAWSLCDAPEAPTIRGGGPCPAVSRDGLMITFDPLVDDRADKSQPRAVSIYDLGSGLPIFQGRVLAVGQGENSTVLNRADDGTPIGTFTLGPCRSAREVQKATVSGTGLVFHTGAQDVPSTSTHDGPINSVHLSPDGQLAVSAGSDQTVRTWNTATGALVAVFRGHTNEVTDAVFSPDGLVVASAGRDGTVRLWDVKSSRELRCLNRASSELESVVTGNKPSVSFSPDGRLLFASDNRLETQVWDFGLPGRIREMEPRLRDARAVLRGNPQDPLALRTLAEWYELRRVWRWAAALLSHSKADAGVEETAQLARCNWLAGEGDLAVREAQRVIEARGPSQGYMRLMRDTIIAQRAASPH